MPRVFKCLLGPAFSLLSLSSPATAQNQPPPQSTPAQQPANSGVTLRATTQLVVVDVVVTDGKQNPIHDLKASDFTLLEKNVPQQIKNFEEHKSLPPAEAAKLQPTPKLPPGIFTNYSPTPVSHTLNVLLLDTLNTPLKDQAFVHDQLRKYPQAWPASAPTAFPGIRRSASPSRAPTISGSVCTTLSATASAPSKSLSPLSKISRLRLLPPHLQPSRQRLQ